MAFYEEKWEFDAPKKVDFTNLEEDDEADKFFGKWFDFFNCMCKLE